MARPRFYNVLRGFRGQAAKDKYIQRLEGLGQGDGIGTKGNRPDSIKLYVTPFGQEVPNNLLFQVSALVPSWDQLKTLTSISSRTKDTLNAGTETAIKVKGYKAPRLVRRTKDSTGTVATSKLTGLKYLKYDTTSVSVPFGRKSATDIVGEAYEEMLIEVPGSTYTTTLIDEEI